MKKGKILVAFSILVIIVAGTLIGSRYYQSDSQIIKRVTSAPLSEVCSICDFKGKHYPCIVNLGTGEIGELKVYNTSPEDMRMISPRWDGGTFSFVNVIGLHSWRDSWTQSIHCDVPIKGDIIKGEYFCLDCRKALVGVGLQGYLIVDCYEKDKLTAYPIVNGESYSIRGYDVTISLKEEIGEKLEVITVGHYMDGMIPND